MGQRTFGVLDGVSMPYSPQHPPKMFDGLSGGEMVARHCEFECKVQSGHIDPSLREVIGNASLSLALRLNEAGLALCDLEDAGSLPGAAFAIARLFEDKIEIVQARDCMVIVEFKNGEIIVSPNKARANDTEMHAHIERLQREIAQETFNLVLEEVPEDKRAQVRGEMWNRLYHILIAACRRDVNRRESPSGYGILNGQLELLDLLWEHTFPRDEVATLLLLSDGMIPWTVMRSTNDTEIGRTVLAEFKRRGLAGLLLSARGTEKQTVATSYTDQAEATAVALVF